jgi:hypothetical protein
MHTFTTKLLLTSLLLATLSLTACGDADESDDLPTPSCEALTLSCAGITGDWNDNFGGMTTITDDLWGADKVIEVDTTNRVAIIQYAEDDMFNPNKFNRYVWTAPAQDGSFFFCTEVFGKDTLAEAKADPATSDASDPTTGGCGMFPWTKMTRR